MNCILFYRRNLTIDQNLNEKVLTLFRLTVKAYVTLRVADWIFRYAFVSPKVNRLEITNDQSHLNAVDWNFLLWHGVLVIVDYHLTCILRKRQKWIMFEFDIYWNCENLSSRHFSTRVAIFSNIFSKRYVLLWLIIGKWMNIANKYLGLQSHGKLSVSCVRLLK